MQLTSVQSRNADGVTSCHDAPLSRVILTSPSSEPAQSTPGSCGDSINAKTVAKVSAPIASLLTGPPVGFSVSGSALVRSGLIGSQLCPSLVLLSTRSPPI